jgi:uncharacterized protein YbaR (Trm112 family)
VSELLDETLARVLVCTVDKADLTEDVEARLLICTECGRRYPVVDGIPNMVVDDSGGDDDQ